jgi:hypothetical protein
MIPLEILHQIHMQEKGDNKLLTIVDREYEGVGFRVWGLEL